MSETSDTACRVAVIGAGAMAREHIGAFQDIPGVSVPGIFNRTRSNAEALAGDFGIARVYDDIAGLYEGTKADLVIVAVYETAIASVIRQCLEFPWAVFMEKPVGLNLDEARAIEKTAEDTGRMVMVGLNRRALSSTRAALDDLAENDEPRFIHVQDQQILSDARAIGHDEEVVQNWMYANSIHLVDYLAAFGRGAVSGISPVIPWSPEAPGIVLATVSFESGDKGLYEAIWNGPGPWACAVTTPSRRWEMRPLEKASYQNSGERKLHAVDTHPWDESFKPGFRQQAEDVVRAMRGEVSPIPRLTGAMKTMTIINGIYGV